MNLDDIVKSNIEMEKRDREIQSIRKQVKRSYENLLNLLEDKDLKIKTEITPKCKAEIKEYFLSKGFSESNKDEKGEVVVADTITYYSKENTCIRVSVMLNGTDEDIITIDIFNSYTQEKISTLRLIFKLDKDSEERFNFKYPIKIENENLYFDNYSNLIDACTNKEELLNLKETISKNIDYIKSNIDKNIPFTYVYEDQRLNQFKKFKQAFEKVLNDK